MREIDFPEGLSEEEKEQLRQMYHDNMAANKDDKPSNISIINA